jgi:hypothetical protein
MLRHLNRRGRPYQLFSNEQVCQKCSLAVRRKAIIYIPIHIIFLCFPVTIYISQYNCTMHSHSTIVGVIIILMGGA